MATVNKDMTIASVIQLDEGTGPVFMSFGMHCISCPVASAETLEQAAEVHGISGDELVNALNDYLSTK